MEIRELELEEVEAFLYTTNYYNKFLIISNDLDKSKIEEIEEEAKDKSSGLWTKND